MKLYTILRRSLFAGSGLLAMSTFGGREGGESACSEN